MHSTGIPSASSLTQRVEHTIQASIHVRPGMNLVGTDTGAVRRKIETFVAELREEYGSVLELEVEIVVAQTYSYDNGPW